MSKELYVGSLSYETTEYDLEKLFSVSGRVTSVHLILDNQTGEFKGCGYVRMSTDAEAKDAIDSLDGAMLIDRRITVSEARPQKMKPQGGGLKGGYKGKATAPREGMSAGAGKPTPSKKTTDFKTGAAKAAAARPASAKPAAAKPGPARATASKPAASKPASAKPAASKPASAKPAASKPASAKPAAAAKPASAKPAAKPATKPSAAKLWFAKSGGKK
jgi:RNA recognition motif-containing protein